MFVGIAAPWCVLRWQRHPAFFRVFIVNEHIHRLTGTMVSNDALDPTGRRLVLIAAEFFPWTLYLLTVLSSAGSRSLFRLEPAKAPRHTLSLMDCCHPQWVQACNSVPPLYGRRGPNQLCPAVLVLLSYFSLPANGSSTDRGAEVILFAHPSATADSPDNLCPRQPEHSPDNLERFEQGAARACPGGRVHPL